MAGSLSIQPLRQELELKPGQSFSSSLVVTNTGKDSITVNVDAESFSVIDEAYDYSFAKAEGLNQWVHIDNPVSTILAGHSYSFNYEVGAPLGAEAGSRYFAVFANVDKPANSPITTLERAGTLLYITVPGNVTRHGQLLDLNMPFLTTDQRVGWQARLKSTGSVHFHSRITVSTYSLFGNRTSQVVVDHLILPNTIRLISGQLSIGRVPGLYRIHWLIGQGDNPAAQRTRWIVYIPIYLWPTLAAAIGLIIYNHVRRRNRRKHY